MQHAVRIVVAALCALALVLLIMYGALSLQTWRTQWSTAPNTIGNYSEQDKLALLASLAATSTPDVETRARILDKLPETSQQPSEEEKLKLLQSLQEKP